MMKFCWRARRMSPPNSAARSAIWIVCCAGDVAQEDREADVVQPGLLLRRGRRGGRPCRPASGPPCSGFERPAEPLFDGLFDTLDAVVVDQELQARLGPRQAVAQVGPPDVEDGLRDDQRFVLRDEDAQVARDARRRRQPAADAQRKPVAAVLARADEDDAVDLGRVALGRARRDGDLVLARQIEVVAVGRGSTARPRRAAGRQSNSSSASRPATGQPVMLRTRVAAAAQRGQADGFERGEDLGELLDLQPVQLDVLARRQLGVVAPELDRQLAQGAVLGRRS